MKCCLCEYPLAVAVDKRVRQPPAAVVGVVVLGLRRRREARGTAEAAGMGEKRRATTEGSQGRFARAGAHVP